ncbi:MAG: hypothetical protein E2604_11325 [Flavobacterium sp.]|nr:hypothetical protein [Flavobacterium sp.]
MTNLIREKRKLPFSFKRINSSIIRALSQIIEDEASLMQRNQSEYYLLYSIDASDSTSFESSSNEIFKEQFLMDTKVVQRVVMRFYTLDNARSIEIQIMHSIKNENSDNYILVSGNDSTWVNGTLHRLSEIIASAEDQSKINNRYSGYILFGLLIFINVEYYRLFYDYFNAVGGWLSVIAILGFPVISLIILVKIFEEVDRIYPSIELQTGALHMQYHRKRRKSLQWWGAAIVIPLLLSFIYDIIKNIAY